MADDLIVNTPLDPNDPDNLKKIVVKEDPPDAPPDDVPDPAQDDHQQADTNVQPEEVIDEGISGAIEVTDPLGPRKDLSPKRDPDQEGFDEDGSSVV